MPRKRFPERAAAYRIGLAKKVVLAVESEAQLHEIAARCDGYGFTLVKDAALTVFKEPTVTALGLGPIAEDEVPEWLSSLPVLV